MNVILYCNKWGETVSFYRDAIGFPIKTATDWLMEFEAGPNACLSVADAKRTSILSAGGAGITVTFKVVNLRSVWQELADKNVRVDPIRDNRLGGHAFFLRDPEGNPLEFWSESSRESPNASPSRVPVADPRHDHIGERHDIMNAERSTMVFGEVASPGIARGPAFVCSCAGDLAVPRRTINASETAKEMARFDAAISQAEQDLLELQKKVQKQMGKQEAGIFQAHILMLHDSLLREKVSDLCLTNKINVEAALDEAIVALTSWFASLENPYFRERAADVRDIGKRLLDVLAKGQRPGAPIVPDGSVIVTSELLPSAIVQLDSQTICGIIVEKGGQTAHATILARARRIPLLIHVPDATKTIRTDDPLIVDGLAGRVFIHPTPDIKREYDRLEADLQAHRTALKGLIDLPAVTQDGVVIKLCANIGKIGEAVAAATLNADGVGLYRTEFVFLVQDHFPSEEEQYQLYRATADRLKPREVVIRALDIGSDKLLPYFPLPRELNPSLGCRGTRLLLANPEILRAQLRAILRLSATHPVSVLFPMIGGMEELLAAKAVIESVKASLIVEHQPFNPRIPVGAMIETPAAAIMIGRLAREVDFFSVGTNDLVQYLLTTDRTSSEMTSYYEPFHPAILQVLASVVGAANAKGKSISICGEIAGNPACTQLLLGLGFRNLSVSPGEILEIKNVVRSTNLSHAGDFARGVLELDTIQEIKACLRVANESLQRRTRHNQSAREL